MASSGALSGNTAAPSLRRAKNHHQSTAPTENIAANSQSRIANSPIAKAMRPSPVPSEGDSAPTSATSATAATSGSRCSPAESSPAQVSHPDSAAAIVRSAMAPARPCIRSQSPTR